MTHEEIIMHHRLNLLQLAKRINNISALLAGKKEYQEKFTINAKRYLTYGLIGLKDSKKSIPLMPNAIKIIEKVWEEFISLKQLMQTLHLM